jgi:hypothetical protein
MGANKANVDKTNCELYNHNQPVVITFHIEYISLISYAIYAIERSLDVGEARPLTLFHDGNPFLQCHFRIRMALDVFIQRSLCENPHRINIFLI